MTSVVEKITNSFKIEEKVDLTTYSLLYSLYDKVAGIYHPPVISRNDEEISRCLKDSLRGNNGVVCSHPEDFSLYCIGAFNERNGDVKTFSPRIVVGNVSQLVEKDISSTPVV